MLNLDIRSLSQVRVSAGATGDAEEEAENHPHHVSGRQRPLGRHGQDPEDHSSVRHLPGPAESGLRPATPGEVLEAPAAVHAEEEGLLGQHVHLKQQTGYP